MRLSVCSSVLGSSELVGKTIIPGLIDVHAHLTVIPRDLLVENHWEPLAYLAFGVTTARDPSNGGEHGFAYGDLVEVGGMVGPRIFGTTAMVPSNFRSEEHTSELQSLMRISYAVFCLKKK